ncbi:hypothetical protein CSB45_10135 [candidate division KSB3 bacterium]|uniref:ABC transporter domain-containing protein n=1 Tax=candidate division KSB3 bacterium TaxID=2044937 RepID=A0A2G6E3Y2_9BACT|nr:MAG: hypothetical protein CSB45_10135 [candidate division KSB3 bacterium]PIE29327.1 MAG: hypothetical protein CSA57_08960 [candidate division KSB3 bacterium]
MSLFLECRQLCFRYPGQAHDLLSALSFSVEQGEYLGLLGAENSGKTTLAKLLKGLVLPTSGTIILPGTENVALSQKMQAQELFQYRHAFGAVFSDPEHQIVGTSVEEDVAFGPGNLRLPPLEIRARTDRCLKQLRLFQYAKRAPHELSGGEQQRLCIAGILAMEPKCLIFDEPFSFLDQKSRQELLQLFQDLQQQGKTLIHLTNDPEELLSCDRVLLLQNGSIIRECTTQQLWQDPEILEHMGISLSEFMQLRHELQRNGYPIRADSFCPNALVEDICKTGS